MFCQYSILLAIWLIVSNFIKQTNIDKANKGKTTEANKSEEKGRSLRLCQGKQNIDKIEI